MSKSRRALSHFKILMPRVAFLSKPWFLGGIIIHYYARRDHFALQQTLRAYLARMLLAR
jgi:hypothetical protein